MKSKYSNDYKQAILLSDTMEEYKNKKKKLYKDMEEGNELSFLNYVDFLEYAKEHKPFDCAQRIIYSQKKKKQKVEDKISELVLNDNAYFLTLTFDNETLAKTSVLTRRRYVARYLKQNCLKYVANIDYGKENGREHYHAVVDNTYNINAKWNYGFSNVEKVGSTIKSKDHTKQENLVCISKYITKLTNHALKQRALGIRLIYSRE